MRLRVIRIGTLNKGIRSCGCRLTRGGDSRRECHGVEVILTEVNVECASLITVRLRGNVGRPILRCIHYLTREDTVSWKRRSRIKDILRVRGERYLTDTPTPTTNIVLTRLQTPP